MTTFTARTPVDLLALVPVVIGFHPEDSVVLLTFGSASARSGHAPADGDSFQARVDLPVVEHQQRVVAQMLHDVVLRHAVPAVALLLYSDDAEVARNFADLLVPVLIDDGVQVIDVLRTDSERYYGVADSADQGTPYDLTSHPLTALGVLQGRVVHESREALGDTLVGTDTAEIQAVAEAADGFMDGLIADRLSPTSAPEVLADYGRWLQRTIARHLATPGNLGSEEVARMVVLLCLDPLREVAWTELRRSNAATYVEFLRSVLRRTPAEFGAGVGGLLALASWLAGDGALAWCAVERSLAVQPDDGLAQHVAALLESATPPSVWAPLPAEALPIFANLT